MLSTPLIEQILSTIPGKTIGLVGDLFLDRYFDIDPSLDEPSVETGLTAYQVSRVRCYPGALGTIMNNLAALGVGSIVPLSVIGDDGEAYELFKALRTMPAIDLSGLVSSPVRRTPTYTKPMYGERELNRIDIKNRTATPSDLIETVKRRLKEQWSRFDALIVLDQVSEADCGVVTATMRDYLAQLAEDDLGKLILADSRERIGLFRNVCVKPNHAELAGAGIHSSEELAAYQKQVGRTVFRTRGADGVDVITAEERLEVAGYPVKGPIDICGAGDSWSAGMTCARMAGASWGEAAAFGNLVASITVQQIGITGTATPAQVIDRWKVVQNSND